MFIFNTISSCVSVRMSRYQTNGKFGEGGGGGVRVALVADGKAKLYRYIKLSTS